LVGQGVGAGPGYRMIQAGDVFLGSSRRRAFWFFLCSAAPRRCILHGCGSRAEGPLAGEPPEQGRLTDSIGFRRHPERKKRSRALSCAERGAGQFFCFGPVHGVNSVQLGSGAERDPHSSAAGEEDQGPGRLCGQVRVDRQGSTRRGGVWVYRVFAAVRGHQATITPGRPPRRFNLGTGRRPVPGHG